MLEQNRTDVENTDYSLIDNLHPLIRSNLSEVKCDECDEVFINKVRLAKHYEKRHAYIT